MHFGEVTFGVDERGEVAMLTRNIKVQASEDAATSYFGGHIMAMGGSKAYVDGVELSRMGQHLTLARYPMHFHLLGEAQGVAVYRSDRAAFGLARIEVGRGEHDLVAAPPAAGVEDFDPVAAALRGPGQLGPRVRAVAVQVERAAHQHDAAVAHGVDVLALDRVGERDRGGAGKRASLAADRQLAAGQVDPLGGQREIALVGEGQLALHDDAAQRGRRNVEHHLDIARDRHRIAFGGNPSAGPCRRIGPAQRAHRCRSLVGGHGHTGMVLCLDGAGTQEQRHGKKRNRQKQARLQVHGTYPLERNPESHSSC